MALPDYLVVARAGLWLRRARLSFGVLSEDRLATCRRVGRGESVEPKELSSGMDCASVFWFVVAFAMVGASLALTVIIGSIFGRSVLHGPLLVIPGLALGAFTFAASSCTFAVVRSMRLYIEIRHPAEFKARKFAAATAYPKPRDSLISLIAGLLTVPLIFI